MKVTYPAKETVSIWVGNFPVEDAFDRCVDENVSPVLALNTHIASICEVAFQPKAISLLELLDGFSGFETFIKSATSAAAANGIATANYAQVCYNLGCSEAPDNWGGLRFLGSFQIKR
jgi:hypothetical protein